jgi:hypothetical protein
LKHLIAEYAKRNSMGKWRVTLCTCLAASTRIYTEAARNIAGA